MKLDVDSLVKTADGFYEKAEATGEIQHVTKGNALKRAAKEKTDSLLDIERQLVGKLDELRNCLA